MKGKSMSKLKKSITVDGVRYLLKLAFDIDDFVGDGIFNLEVYNNKGERELGIPFASSRGLPREWWVEAKETVKNMRY